MHFILPLSLSISLSVSPTFILQIFKCWKWFDPDIRWAVEAIYILKKLVAFFSCYCIWNDFEFTFYSFCLMNGKNRIQHIAFLFICHMFTWQQYIKCICICIYINGIRARSMNDLINLTSSFLINSVCKLYIYLFLFFSFFIIFKLII